MSMSSVAADIGPDASDRSPDRLDPMPADSLTTLGRAGSLPLAVVSVSGCRFGSAHLRSKADAPGARGTSADASFTAPPRAARWRDSSVFHVLCGPGRALDAPASGPFALAFGFPGRSLHFRAVSAPFSSRPLAVAARGLAGRLPWRSSGHAPLPVASPSWLGLRLGALPACSPRRLPCPTRSVCLGPLSRVWCPSRLWAARRPFLLGLRVLGRFRAGGVLLACGRPAFAFAVFAGSAGSAWLFSRLSWPFPLVSQVRTGLFMRVSSLYRPVEWTFAPVVVCSQAVLGGSSWPRCYMVVALLT